MSGDNEFWPWLVEERPEKDTSLVSTVAEMRASFIFREFKTSKCVCGLVHVTVVKGMMFDISLSLSDNYFKQLIL